MFEKCKSIIQEEETMRELIDKEVPISELKPLNRKRYSQAVMFTRTIFFTALKSSAGQVIRIFSKPQIDSRRRYWHKPPYSNRMVLDVMDAFASCIVLSDNYYRSGPTWLTLD
jgi:hypothetical protein